MGLSTADITRLNEIVCNLIVRNMQAGASYKKAKAQAYNRLEAEHPEVLAAWLTHYKGGK